MENDKVFELLTKMYSEMNNRFDKLENKVDNLENKVGNLEGEVGGLKGEVSKLGAKIEGELIPKQQALFDGYSANTEKISELVEVVEDMKVDINNIGIKTLRTDNDLIGLKKVVTGR